MKRPSYNHQFQSNFHLYHIFLTVHFHWFMFKRPNKLHTEVLLSTCLCCSINTCTLSTHIPKGIWVIREFKFSFQPYKLDTFNITLSASPNMLKCWLFLASVYFILHWAYGTIHPKFVMFNFQDFNLDS